jgi:class 3 adenylate cyclase
VPITSDWRTFTFCPIREVAPDRLCQPLPIETQRNVDVPDERRLDIRMGIALGNVIIQDDEFLSDGVEIAGDQG